MICNPNFNKNKKASKTFGSSSIKYFITKPTPCFHMHQSLTKDYQICHAFP